MSEIDISTLEVVNNRAEHRYEIVLGDDAAVCYYRLTNGGIIFIHTEVPPVFEGKGVAGKLAKAALDDAVRLGLKIEPQCPYIKKYIERHPEYQPYTRGHSSE